MIRTVTLLLGFAAVAATAAVADGGGPGAGTGQAVRSPDGTVTYMTDTRPKRGRTIVHVQREGRFAGRVGLRGAFGVPVVGAAGQTDGVSHDGRTLVLAHLNQHRFAVLDTRTLTLREIVRLRGNFSYDALSPRGRTLYLIQHVVMRNANANRYYVRAYDLRRHRLLKKIIFDRRENWGLMSGSPVMRVTSPTGRWAYTLYSRPGGSPFVHALDTVKRRAVCIDLPWRGSQAQVFRMQLKLRGTKLVVGADWATTYVAVIDTRTFRVRSAAHR